MGLTQIPSLQVGHLDTFFHDTSMSSTMRHLPKSALVAPPRAPNADNNMGIPSPKPASVRGLFLLILRVEQILWVSGSGNTFTKKCAPWGQLHIRIPEAEADSFLTVRLASPTCIHPECIPSTDPTTLVITSGIEASGWGYGSRALQQL